MPSFLIAIANRSCLCARRSQRRSMSPGACPGLRYIGRSGRALAEPNCSLPEVGARRSNSHVSACSEHSASTRHRSGKRKRIRHSCAHGRERTIQLHLRPCIAVGNPCRHSTCRQTLIRAVLVGIAAAVVVYGVCLREDPRPHPSG